ncbi:MAG: hypothetical protein C7B45_03520 [Sulfobacillus acidophilus]|uniref:Uncharacterized protein n=1 Tax=Sulfobacillus acidophilus TaxID=53633 RepID=A0A2T2WME3_9FIRM|nr:MAG: hypothetical protein C7B45_03520 [Sulfobacillus acidophilus]
MAIANAPDKILADLIKRFVRALDQERTSRWDQIDVAARIAEQFGYVGVRRLVGEAGLDARTVQTYIRVGRTFPRTVRAQFPTLLFTHYREALQNAALFTSGPGTDPVWWAQQAFYFGWSTGELRRQGRLQMPVNADAAPAAEDVVHRAVRMAMEGRLEEGKIEAALAQYNALYAPVTGTVLTLCRASYVPPEAAS